MKTIYVQNGIVVGLAHVIEDSPVTVTGPAGSAAYEVANDVNAQIGYTCTIVSDLPVFSAPAAQLPLLTPMTLYMAFTPAERIAIKASNDPLVKEFWDMYQLSVQLNKPTDPNLISVQEALTYLATPKSPGPGGGILASTARIEQIRNGIAQ